MVCCGGHDAAYHILFPSEDSSAVPEELKRHYPGPATFWDTPDLWVITLWLSGPALVLFSPAGQCKAQLMLSFITTTALTHRVIKE